VYGPNRVAGKVLLWPLVLLPVLGWFAGLIVNQGCNNEHSRSNAARAAAIRLEMEIEMFRLDCGRLPDSLDELSGVVRGRNCVKNPVRRSVLLDPLGVPMVYWRSADGSAFDVRSIGRDRVYGSADDVSTSDREWPWPRPWNWQVIGRRALALLVLIAFVASAAYTVFLGLWAPWRVARGIVRRRFR
jgi:hypothetical protein